MILTRRSLATSAAVELIPESGKPFITPLNSPVEVQNALGAIPRREFLTISVAASGGLLIGFCLPETMSVAVAKSSSAAEFSPNAFVRIGTDEAVTVIVNHSEMGQGVYTNLPMILADELEAKWNHVRFAPAPVDPVCNHPVFGIQITGGNTSTWSSLEQFREAGAAARVMLITAAAQSWNVDPASCRAENGYVLDGSGHRASYGQLAAKAAIIPPPLQVQLKEAKDFKLIGKPLKRLDTPQKTNGKAIFGNSSASHPRLAGQKTARRPEASANPVSRVLPLPSPMPSLPSLGSALHKLPMRMSEAV